MLDFSSPAFWIAVVQIVAIDILLGGDNAIVIALACRRLPEPLRKKGIFWGIVGAIGLRVVLIFFALQLLAIPFLKIVGGILLLWIGVKLLQPEHEDSHGNIESSTTLAGAIKTIIIADAVMSLDNVVAVAGAAHGSMVLVVFGILVSIPIVAWGSKLVLTLMDKFPIVITGGGMLLGWIGGGMIATDPVTPEAWLKIVPQAGYVTSAFGAIFVLTLGTWLARRQKARPAHELSLTKSDENLQKGNL